MPTLLDRRFDEFAAATHENLAPRAAVAVGAGLAALILLPPALCLAWTLCGLAIESWCWFASRPQFLRRQVSLAQQLAFVANLVCLIANWFGLALLLWKTGRIEGAVSATIIWISIIGFA